MKCSIKDMAKNGTIKVGLRRKVCFTIVMKDAYNNAAKISKNIKEKTKVTFSDVNLVPMVKLNTESLGLECWVEIKTHGIYTFKVSLLCGVAYK